MLQYPSILLIISDGVHLVFVFLAEALAGVPVAPVYSIMFFAMLLLSIHTTEVFLVRNSAMYIVNFELNWDS